MVDSFTAKVRDLSAKGLGVVDHPDGMVFFVEGVLPGDEGDFEVTAREKRYGFAKLRQLAKTSADRVAAPCRYQGFDAKSCHGCPWMIIRYEAQLEKKQQLIDHYLERNQLLNAGTVVHPIQGSPLTVAYRNRAQFKTDGERLGYVASDQTKQIIDIEQCMILTKTNQQTLAAIRKSLPNKAWRPAPGLNWNTLDIDDKVAKNDIKLNVKLPFAQGNTAQNAFMKAWLCEKLQALGELGEVLELFCGSGNFTETLVGHAKRVLAVEAAQAAIDQLNSKHWPGVEGLALDLFKTSAIQIIKRRGLRPRTLLLDPPRVGFKLLGLVIEAFPSIESVIYISCDVASFSYDAKALAKHGFKLREAQGLDQFPHTPHVELLSLFTKDKA